MNRSMLVGVVLLATCGWRTVDADAIGRDSSEIVSAHGAGAGGRPMFGRIDVLLGVAAACATLAAASGDVGIRHEALESHSRGEHELAVMAEHLGNGAVLIPALAGAWLLGRAAHQPRFSGSVVRIGASALVAGVGAVVLKEAVGRARPLDAPDDQDEIAPFSGHDSFPSGHTTLAFALAAAVDRETGSRWVPWVAYPVAGLVGWSRVHDDRHWTSDVIFGAALGIWTAGKTEVVLQGGAARSRRLGIDVSESGRGPRAGLGLKF